VEPMEVIDRGGGKTDVKVHQLVKTLGGDVLSDMDAWHVNIIANGLIERMDIRESDSSSHQTPSAAFSSSMTAESRQNRSRSKRGDSHPACNRKREG
jgi:hypothetical protein